MAQGEYWRGVEMVMPKFVRDPMKAYRYHEEGALSSKGLAYKEASAFTWVELALQAGGLSDSDLMKQYDTNRALKSYERHVLDRRQQLMTAYWLAWKGRDAQLMVMVKKRCAALTNIIPLCLWIPVP
ncbi:hypothetical protein [Vibrio penaeicida]|nr:hypothetical protein [Vibrio penaeicida]